MVVSAGTERRRRGAAAGTASAVRSASAGGLRVLLRPFGYLAFVVAVAAMRLCARLLGERHELGYFAARLSGTLEHYPEVTRAGVRAAWGAWAFLLALSISPLDPVAGDWDELGLAALAVVVVLGWLLSGTRAGR